MKKIRPKMLNFMRFSGNFLTVFSDGEGNQWATNGAIAIDLSLLDLNLGFLKTAKKQINERLAETVELRIKGITSASETSREGGAIDRYKSSFFRAENNYYYPVDFALLENRCFSELDIKNVLIYRSKKYFGEIKTAFNENYASLFFIKGAQVFFSETSAPAVVLIDNRIKALVMPFSASFIKQVHDHSVSLESSKTILSESFKLTNNKKVR